jgi:carboxypeptidase C (cathepsin A)
MEDGAQNFTFNDWAWNNNANMFYIESPANVGYSVCEDLDECQWTDANSADDNLAAVLYLLQSKFTALQNNDLYISGESYAGIYVPQLMLRLDKFINETKPTGKWIPNLKGMMVGNGVTNWKYDCTPAYFHMGYYHGLVSDELFNNVNANCDLSYIDSPNPPVLSAQCQTWMDKFNSLVTLVNVYDIFGKCYKNPSIHRKINGMKLQEVSDAAPAQSEVRGLTSEKYTPFLKSKNPLSVVPPCVYAEPILEYFNNQTIKDALHISPKAAAKWDLCADAFNYTGAQNATQWIYPILKGRYRMLKYSGDADGAVPTFGTQGWINELNWEVKEQWRPYYITNMYGQQVAGYVEVRDGGFTFATVHGAGHMAPQFKRQPTYHAIFNWLNGQPL